MIVEIIILIYKFYTIPYRFVMPLIIKFILWNNGYTEEEIRGFIKLLNEIKYLDIQNCNFPNIKAYQMHEYIKHLFNPLSYMLNATILNCVIIIIFRILIN